MLRNGTTDLYMSNGLVGHEEGPSQLTRGQSGIAGVIIVGLRQDATESVPKETTARALSLYFTPLRIYLGPMYKIS